jgi:Tol biopolymer transport system component
VSTDSNGQQPIWNGPMDSERPVFSPDSRTIAFSSYSPFLVANDSNTAQDIFVKDLTTGAITRVSTSSSGAQAQGQSVFPAWSPDGSKLAFQSAANTLVPGDTNVAEDIFVKNLATGALQLVSTRATGEPALFDHRAPSWSPDSRRLVWFSEAVNLSTEVDTNQRPDVYTKDLTTGFVQLVSSTSGGIQGDNRSNTFSIAPGAWSRDGSRVIFLSSSQNLSASDGNGFAEDLFVKAVG